MSFPLLFTNLNVLTPWPVEEPQSRTSEKRKACTSSEAVSDRHARRRSHTLLMDPVRRDAGLIEQPCQDVAGLRVVAEEVQDAPALCKAATACDDGGAALLSVAEPSDNQLQILLHGGSFEMKSAHLLNVVLRVRSQSVHKVRESHSIADEEPAASAGVIKQLPNAGSASKHFAGRWKGARTQECCCQPAQQCTKSVDTWHNQLHT